VRFSTLTEWLAWQETLHPQAIDLGLERVAAVAASLNLLHPDALVISVAGTNGKGSTLAMLESILCAAGYRVGKYTSPHLLQYNERICVDQQLISDSDLCHVFARIDRARADISLSYFEFSTLAALQYFFDQKVDIFLLEVGLGGRLDAVNIMDADIALVTNVDLDHQDWLGDDVESIAYEKAGIFRTQRPAICAQPQPPLALMRQVRDIAAIGYQAGVDFSYRVEAGRWSWHAADKSITSLPMPALHGTFQLQNAAAVMQVLQLIEADFPVSQQALELGLTHVQLAGRMQHIDGEVDCILDVAHNPHAARALVKALPEKSAGGRYLLVLGMLADKDVETVTSLLSTLSTQWYLGGLDVNRGLSAEALAGRVVESLDTLTIACHDDISTALVAARKQAGAGDTILVCGSFYSVAEALVFLQQERDTNE